MGPRVRVRHEMANFDAPGHGEAIDGFGIANGVAADDGATDFGGFLETAAQNGGDRFWSNKVGRESHYIKSSERPAAHGEDVGECVGRGDLTVSERVVDDGREKIDRLHERAVAIQPINTGVVARA